MATLGPNYTTLYDLSRLQNSGLSQQTAFIECMNKVNSVFQDMPATLCNNGTFHKFPYRTSLPAINSVFWNEGAPKQKTSAGQGTAETKFFRSGTDIDLEILNIEADPNWEANTNAAFAEAFAQKISYEFFYGNDITNSRDVKGMANRYNVLKPFGEHHPYVCLNGQGSISGKNTSIWLVGWASNTITGIYPTNGHYGLDIKKMSEQVLTDPNGNEFPGVKYFYSLYFGLAVLDPRFAVRIANINIDDFETSGDSTDTSKNILKLMNQAKLSFRSLQGMYRPVFYMSQRAQAALQQQIEKKSGHQITVDYLQNPMGTVRFNGIECKVDDALLNTEGIVIS